MFVLKFWGSTFQCHFFFDTILVWIKNILFVTKYAQQWKLAFKKNHNHSLDFVKLIGQYSYLQSQSLFRVCFISRFVTNWNTNRINSSNREITLADVRCFYSPKLLVQMSTSYTRFNHSFEQIQYVLFDCSMVILR